jgi:hypothetical protein
MLFDKKMEDTLALWHSSSGICWGSYNPKITRLEDIVKLRDDVQQLLTTINVRSIGARNLHDKQSKLYTIVRQTAPQSPELHDTDFSEVADLIDEKHPEKSKGKDELWQT